MNMALQDEILQTKPFDSLEQEAFLNLLRTTDCLQRGVVEALKPHGLTMVQYNVLRILRGSGETPLSCGEIAGRLITRDPDITRLLDRMEANGWVTRTRDEVDRRVVKSRITPAGLDVLAALDPTIRDLHRRLLGHLSADELTTLNDLLTAARSRAV